MTTSRYVRSLSAMASSVVSKVGALGPASGEGPLSLRYLAMNHVMLAPGAVRGPHWHEDASELVFCVSGNVLVSVLGEGDDCQSIRMDFGTMLHVAPDALHTIENIGMTFAELIVVTSFEGAETISLFHAFLAMSVAGRPDPATPDQKDHAIVDIGFQSMSGDAPEGGASRERMSARVNDDLLSGHFAGCAVQWIRPALRQMLKDLSLCSVREKSRSRETRSYPNFVAMAYIQQGRARLSVLDPLGQVETYELDPAACATLFRRGQMPDRAVRAGHDAAEQGPPIIVFEQPMLADALYRSATCSLTSILLSAMCDLEDGALHLPSCDRFQNVTARWIDILD